jgi:hypothetical protein
MRSLFAWIGLSFGFALLALFAFAALAAFTPACGSTTDDTAPTDAAGDVAVDTGPPDSATCDLSANLLDKIPDASIADGASTTGICLGCASANCGSFISQCNQSCPCQSAISTGLTCYVQHSDQPTVCVASFLGVDPNIQTIGFSLVSCVQTKCDNECQASKFEDAGKEAGP